MKNLIVLFTFLFLSSSAYSQIDYPRYEQDSLGQTVVVMTIEQAQALDNNTDLLSLFRKLDAQLLDYDSLCVKVISDKDEIITKQTVQINKLKETLAVKGDEITNLQKRIVEKDAEIANLNIELQNKKDEIKLHKKELKKGKAKAFTYGAVGGFFVGIILTLLIIH
jgi:uncharacterized protein (DUF3084 family)